MFVKRYKSLLMWFAFAFFLSFITVYHYTTILPQEVKEQEYSFVGSNIQKVVRPEMNVFIREKYALCEKYYLSCSNDTLLEGAARSSLNNLSEDEVIIKYPEDAGWKVIWENNKLILQQTKPGLCPEHQKRWHLEPDETGEKVAVYFGPAQIGKEGGEVQSTEIMISNLSSDLQLRIKNGSFDFINWDDLVATLDSLSEKE